MGESTKMRIQSIMASRPQNKKLIKIPKRVSSIIFLILKLGKRDLNLIFILMKNVFIKNS